MVFNLKCGNNNILYTIVYARSSFPMGVIPCGTASMWTFVKINDRRRLSLGGTII